MIFARRDRTGPRRFTVARLALFFLAAAVWLGGLLTGRSLLTGAAIAVLLAAVVLGMADRTPPRPPDD